VPCAIEIGKYLSSDYEQSTYWSANEKNDGKDSKDTYSNISILAWRQQLNVFTREKVRFDRKIDYSPNDELRLSGSCAGSCQLKRD
jgi:hypothetical protein